MNNRRLASILALGAGLFALGSWYAMAQDAPAEPPVYSSLYTTLSRELDMFEQTVKGLPGATTPKPLIFGTDFSFANNGNGPILFDSRVQRIAKMQADRFKEMGIGGVHLTLGWPQMSAKYDPDYQKYLAYYTSLADELRARHIVIVLHSNIVFPRPFSRYDHPVPHISFAEYKQEKRLMTQNLISAIHPDYFILTSEPKSDAHNSGISELDDPGSARELVNYVINGDGHSVGPLEKGTTLVGAGADNWETPAFAENYVTIPHLDFLNIHVYPFGPENQHTLLSIVDIGHRHNMRMLIDEAWLYKTDAPRTAQTEAYKRDMFSFFEPLDERFLGSMAEFCRKEGIEFFSGFWARNFFAYIDYAPGDENRTYQDLGHSLGVAMRQSVINDKLSALGDYYKRLISGK